MRNAALRQAMTPPDAADMLRELAQAYREDAAELQAAWQDAKAGKVWEVLAAELERAADKAEREWSKL